MCLIAIGPIPDDKILESAEESNPHGIGIAWQEKDGVHWEKGLELKDLKRFPDWIKKNCAVHFRWGTAGDLTEEMTHPFPLSEGVPLGLTGTSKHGVLMHNGHFSGWEKIAKNMGCDLTGDVSDSRFLAWLVVKYGPDILYMVTGQRILVFTDKMWMYGDWVQEGERWYSNSSFRYTTKRVRTISKWSRGGYTAGCYGDDYTDGCHNYLGESYTIPRKSDYDGTWYETQGGLRNDAPPAFDPKDWNREVTKSGAIIYRRKTDVVPITEPKKDPIQRNFSSLEDCIRYYENAKKLEKEAKTKKDMRLARRMQSAALDCAVGLNSKDDISLLKESDGVITEKTDDAEVFDVEVELTTN